MCAYCITIANIDVSCILHLSVRTFHTCTQIVETRVCPPPSHRQHHTTHAVQHASCSASSVRTCGALASSICVVGMLFFVVHVARRSFVYARCVAPCDVTEFYIVQSPVVELCVVCVVMYHTIQSVNAPSVCA